MYVSVLFHVALLVKPLAAVLARIGPRVGMYEQMSGEGAGALEALAALTAFEQLLELMRVAVVLQADQVAERLVADVALVGALLVEVCAARVHLEAVRRAELFLALVAAIFSAVACRLQTTAALFFAHQHHQLLLLLLLLL